jgi:hypothetical protein
LFPIFKRGPKPLGFSNLPGHQPQGAESRAAGIKGGERNDQFLDIM